MGHFKNLEITKESEFVPEQETTMGKIAMRIPNSVTVKENQVAVHVFNFLPKTQKPRNAQDFARWSFRQMRNWELFVSDRSEQEFEAEFSLVTDPQEINAILGGDNSIKAAIFIGWSDWDRAEAMWKTVERAPRRFEVKPEVSTSFGEFGWNVITFHKNR